MHMAVSQAVLEVAGSFYRKLTVIMILWPQARKVCVKKNRKTKHNQLRNDFSRKYEISVFSKLFH